MKYFINSFVVRLLLPHSKIVINVAFEL